MRAAAIVLAVVLAAAPATKCSTDTGKPNPAPRTSATCEEDQTWCWDCTTNGNKKCGPGDVRT